MKEQLKAYTIKIKKSPRARKVYQWTRFAPDAFTAANEAQIAAREEYGPGAVVISVEIPNPADLEVGDFIHIPAWGVYGMVTSIANVDFGGINDRRVTLQEHPDQPTRSQSFYHLIPGQFVMESASD